MSIGFREVPIGGGDVIAFGAAVVLLGVLVAVLALIGCDVPELPTAPPADPDAPATIIETSAPTVRRVYGDSIEIQPGQVGSLKVTCETGHVVTGGCSSSVDGAIVVVASKPTLAPDGWRCAGRASDDGPAAMSVSVVCEGP